MQVAEAVNEYISVIQVTRRPRTVDAAQQILAEWLRLLPAGKHIEDVSRHDLLAYLTWLKNARQSSRTAANKYVRIVALLRHHNVPVHRGDRPRFVRALPQVYEQEEIEQFMSACDIYQRGLFQTLLECGLRKEEARHLRWTDIEAGPVIHIQPHLPGFNPKSHEERRIPISRELLSLLRQPQQRSALLVFATARGNSDKHMLRTCKVIAKRAGLDPEKFWLHRWRSTFATRLLRGGLDLRSVQQLLGHRDIQSTMAYLRPAEGQELRDRMAAAFATPYMKTAAV